MNIGCRDPFSDLRFPTGQYNIHDVRIEYTVRDMGESQLRRLIKIRLHSRGKRLTLTLDKDRLSNQSLLVFRLLSPKVAKEVFRKGCRDLCQTVVDSLHLKVICSIVSRLSLRRLGGSSLTNRARTPIVSFCSFHIAVGHF